MTLSPSLAVANALRAGNMINQAINGFADSITEYEGDSPLPALKFMIDGYLKSLLDNGIYDYVLTDDIDGSLLVSVFPHRQVSPIQWRIRFEKETTQCTRLPL